MTDTASGRPGVIAPPPVLYVAFLLAGIGLDFIRPMPLFATMGVLPGAALLAAGALLVLLCARRFRAAGTNVPTNLPVTALVREGPCRFSRDPIYLGLTATYLGLGLLLDDGWVLLLALPLLAIMRYGVIAREERYLENKFGGACLACKREVRL